jgi:hypothetical protein
MSKVSPDSDIPEPEEALLGAGKALEAAINDVFSSAPDYAKKSILTIRYKLAEAILDQNSESIHSITNTIQKVINKCSLDELDPQKRVVRAANDFCRRLTRESLQQYARPDGPGRFLDVRDLVKMKTMLGRNAL